MPSIWLTATISASILIILIIIQICARSKHPIRQTFSGIFMGIGTLALVNISGTFTGVTLPVSLLSLGISAVSGIPGVTMLLVLKMIAN